MEFHYKEQGQPPYLDKLFCKSRLLEEIKIDDEKIYVATSDGNELSAPRSECSIYYQEDKSGMEVLVKSGNNQIEFWENGNMENDEEWKKIKAFIQEHQSTTFDFVTHKPKWWQQLSQMYFILPKSRRLNEIRYDGTNLYVSTLSGKELSAPLSECTIHHEYDGYKRIIVIIKSGDTKLRFQEIGYTLSDVEWAVIKHFVLYTCRSTMTTATKVVSAATKVLELFKD